MRDGLTRPDARAADHRARRAGVGGLVSLVGVKYTTARLAAARAVDVVFAELGRPPQPSRTGARPLPFAEVADVEGRVIETARDTSGSRSTAICSSTWNSGTAPRRLRSSSFRPRTMRSNAWRKERRCGRGNRLCRRPGAAVRLSDAVLRRTPLGSAGHPGRPALDRAADIMGSRLGWTAAMRAEEIAAVERRYPSGR